MWRLISVLSRTLSIGEMKTVEGGLFFMLNEARRAENRGRRAESRGRVVGGGAARPYPPTRYLGVRSGCPIDPDTIMLLIAEKMKNSYTIQC